MSSWAREVSASTWNWTLLVRSRAMVMKSRRGTHDSSRGGVANNVVIAQSVGQFGPAANSEGTAAGSVEATMSIDRFGNRHAIGLPYARGRIVASTQDDVRKLRRAWQVMKQRIRRHGPNSLFNFSGLERALHVQPNDLPHMDDDIAPALYLDQFRDLALRHLGGSPHVHEVALFNRVTAALFATHLALVKPGDIVIGVSPSYTHPAAVRAASQVGARFLDTCGAGAFTEALRREKNVRLVVLTRLAVTYNIMPTTE